MTRIFLCCILTLSIVTAAFAQTFSFQPPTNGNSAPAPAAGKIIHPQPVPVLSPEDYRNQVGAVANQNQSLLTQQATKLLSNTLPSKPPADINTPQTMTTTTPQQTINPTQQNAPITSPPPSVTQQTPPTQPMPTAPQPVQPKSQPYTGFQGNAPANTNTNTNTPPSQNSGGGWNIKY